MFQISAEVENREGSHQAIVSTNGNDRSLAIPAKPAGAGSSVNGGELLFLALATCFCNDLYREAARRGITVRSVRVVVAGDFGDTPGSCAQNVTYRATVEADASEAEILDLMRHTDTVAEIQNTLRQGVPVTLVESNAISMS